MSKSSPVHSLQSGSKFGPDAGIGELDDVSVVTENGKTIVVSRYADDVWDFWPYFEQSNVQRSGKRISWASLSSSFVPGVKDVIFRYWIAGLPGRTRPSARTVIATFSMLKVFVDWLVRQEIWSLSDVRPLHTVAFVTDCRSRGVTPRGQTQLYRAVELLYALRSHSRDPLVSHPWPGSTAASLSGFNGPSMGDSAQTPVIPNDALRVLFRFAEQQILEASHRLDQRDAGLRHAFRDPELLLIRDAAFFLTGLLSGMRCEELVGIQIMPVRSEQLQGDVVYWLKSVEHKSGYGEGEWMVPELVSQCMTVMERWSAPFRQKVAGDILVLEAELESTTDRADGIAFLSQLAGLRADSHRLFLGSSRGRISAMSADAWRRRMKQFSKEAREGWALSPHQLRRTFVVSCAHHALGDLVYLKHQLKHRSLDMTALYAHNSRQDETLFEEILDATREAKVAMVEHWLNPESLLAGGGAPMVRANKLESVASRRALAEDTADKIVIRATGHGWCLAQDDGCGGRGLWEKTRCVDCHNAVIDERDIEVWRGIYAQQQELLGLVNELGPGAERRIRRDVEHAARVLRELGVTTEPAVETK